MYGLWVIIMLLLFLLMMIFPSTKLRIHFEMMWWGPVGDRILFLYKCSVVSLSLSLFLSLSLSLSGFREHHSCHTALTSLVDTFYKNINNDEFTGVHFVDFAKAFDIIDRDLLLRKLALYWLTNNTLHLISSIFVKSRTACLYKQLNPIFFP